MLMLKKIIATALLSYCMVIQGNCQSEQLIINLPDRSDNRLLTFENPKGSIKVTGFDGDAIVVTASLRFPEQGKIAGNGLRKIEQNSLDIGAEVIGSNIILACRTTGKTVDFDIKIPEKFSLKLKSLDNGNVDVIHIRGEIEIENGNGNISLENVSGSAILSSIYGNIHAVFREVKPDSPMIFTSFEGDISITFPETINAKLKIKSDKGEILTDFDIKPGKREPVVKNVDKAKVYSLEDWVVGSINQGGPEYVIRSYNGDVTIKKK
jgi:hypothetical protein